MKQVQLGPYTQDNDVLTKAKQIRQWVKKGERDIRVFVFMKGRAKTHPELGRTVIERLLRYIDDICTAPEPSLKGSSWAVVLRVK